ncbi:hypothetical protein K0U27_05860 [archaeon]|nr:hypothetical protein [archaeon]
MPDYGFAGSKEPSDNTSRQGKTILQEEHIEKLLTMTTDTKESRIS